MNIISKSSMRAAAFLILLLIVFPIGYLKMLEVIVTHPGLRLIPGWEDKTFDAWTLAYNRPINASISVENGILKVYGSGNLSAGTIVAAQRFKDVNVDISIYRYLRVLIRTSSINVAARIVIWSAPSQPCVVLFKTYNDAEWHTEIVDLSFFGLTGSPYMIELTWMQIYDLSDSSSIAWYREISFNKLEV